MPLREDTWALSVCKRLNDSWSVTQRHKPKYEAICKKELPYRNEVFGYQANKPIEHRTPEAYQTDVLVIENRTDGTWIPRVVIECKLASITTHDAITYSAKAATHKQVHPYLRYGILIGAYKTVRFPLRLFRHGAYFDFMVAWRGQKTTRNEWQKFVQLIRREIRASQQTERFLLRASDNPYTIIHRPLIFDR
ncbi:MAG TPA: hypothetical protein VN802_22220 [Stellaceae bacterium]|nr:hypothetical protein [Stellaceae bacterium]